MVSEEKIFEIVDGRRTDDGRTPDHGHPISSPCEPNGSGELKNDIFLGFAQNIDCGYMLELPRRGTEYPQSIFWSKNKKICILLHTPVVLLISWRCFPDEELLKSRSIKGEVAIIQTFFFISFNTLYVKKSKIYRVPSKIKKCCLRKFTDINKIL